MVLWLFARNRLPNCSDDLSHWSDIFSWRQLHYKHLVKAYEGSTQVSGEIQRALKFCRSCTCMYSMYSIQFVSMHVLCMPDCKARLSRVDALPWTCTSMHVCVHINTSTKLAYMFIVSSSPNSVKLHVALLRELLHVLALRSSSSGLVALKTPRS